MHDSFVAEGGVCILVNRSHLLLSLGGGLSGKKSRFLKPGM